MNRPPPRGDPTTVRDPRKVRDRTLLMGARATRGFGAGALSIVLATDLAGAGYSSLSIGVWLGLALAGSAAWALAVPRIELVARRRTVFAVSALSLAVGGALLWADVSSPPVLLAALLLGGIVAGGADVSPLAALEQAALAGTTADVHRTRSYATYNLVGYVGVAIGALAAVPMSSTTLAPLLGVQSAGHDPTFLFYGLLGFGLIPLYLSLSAEDLGRRHGARAEPLSPQSRPTVYSLSALFSVDAFAGGLIVNSLVVYFFTIRYHPGLDALGLVFSVSNLAAGLSLVLAAPLARRFGLVNTMVFSHLPSNVFLVLVLFAPTFGVASALWIARATLSQMDVPTRQSYTQAIVPERDRAAAAGYTTAARSVQALGAPVAGSFLALGGPWVGAPFALAGSIKIAYDAAVYSRFRKLPPPEEGPGRPPSSSTGRP